MTDTAVNEEPSEPSEQAGAGAVSPSGSSGVEAESGKESGASIETERVGLFGFSQGALLAALLVARHPTRFAFAVLVGSGDVHDPLACDILDKYHRAATAEAATDHATNAAPPMPRRAASPWVPCLHVAGGSDPLVSVDACTALARRLAPSPPDGSAAGAAVTAASPLRVHVVQGGGHGMPPNKDLAVLKGFLDSLSLAER
jgi:predicted esterase